MGASGRVVDRFDGLIVGLFVLCLGDTKTTQSRRAESARYACPLSTSVRVLLVDQSRAECRQVDRVARAAAEANPIQNAINLQLKLQPKNIPHLGIIWSKKYPG